MKVFIIDDEEVSLYIIRHMLMLEGIAAEEKITSFRSASNALEVLIACNEQELPAVILLDLAMPVIDGWQFLELLDQSGVRFEDRCRIYILTSSINDSDRKRAEENPMISGFIHKPIRIADIRMLYSGEKPKDTQKAIDQP